MYLPKRRKHSCVTFNVIKRREIFTYLCVFFSIIRGTCTYANEVFRLKFTEPSNATWDLNRYKLGLSSSTHWKTGREVYIHIIAESTLQYGITRVEAFPRAVRVRHKRFPFSSRARATRVERDDKKTVDGETVWEFPWCTGERNAKEFAKLARPGRRRSVTKDKCVHRLEGVSSRRSVLTPC